MSRQCYSNWSLILMPPSATFTVHLYLQLESD